MQQTIVLVHGAFADSSSWNDVIDPLTERGHTVVAWANPLRGVAADAAALTDLVRSIDGPVVLVGHSYGGAVITNVSAGAGSVTGIVYVASFPLIAGESCADASALAPGSTLGETLQPVPLAGGGNDLYIAQDRFHQQFCADLSERQARLMAVTQRPITDAALGEASGPAPLWQSVPSWSIFGDQDRNIPVAAMRTMAERAGVRRAVEIAGASHVVGMSHPAETVELVLEAADAAAPAQA
ncbi:alpha/beta hydrolase [Modestobacter sp. NPDC049651]|uniref:alpha/beta fold hydrolase n=1 Tax=unclassified Modestobacter TaxID=2643866 RepID=UPI0033F79888